MLKTAFYHSEVSVLPSSTSAFSYQRPLCSCFLLICFSCMMTTHLGLQKCGECVSALPDAVLWSPYRHQPKKDEWNLVHSACPEVAETWLCWVPAAAPLGQVPHVRLILVTSVAVNTHQQDPHIPFIDKYIQNCTRAEGRSIRLKEEQDIGPFIGLTSMAASASGADSFLGTLWSKDTHAFTQRKLGMGL